MEKIIGVNAHVEVVFVKSPPIFLKIFSTKFCQNKNYAAYDKNCNAYIYMFISKSTLKSDERRAFANYIIF